MAAMEFYDTEKGQDVDAQSKEVYGQTSPSPELAATSSLIIPPPQSKFARWNEKIESFAGLEARGITRVEPWERQEASILAYMQMLLIWFSSNITANNLAVGLLGPLVYELSFLDAAFCGVFGILVGSLGTAYMSIWGAQSGNRTMICARYFMGYSPSKICCLLNIVIMVGYGMIDCVIGGQILSAVSGGSMSIVVGIIIVALITWVVSIFGMAVFHYYERFAWIPQIIVLFILIGVSAKHYDTKTPSVGTPSDISANRLSFFSLCLSLPVCWAAAASDFYVYYPEKTPKTITFFLTLTGLTLSTALVLLIGIGLGSGVPNVPSWSTAYDTSSGALILAGFSPVGGFGKFCGVIVALGVIANNIPGTYSAALGVQVLGRYTAMIPRWICTCLIVLIYFICAIVGRNNLFDIFENFLALMGYWVTIFISIVLEEHLIFRRNVSFEWEAWADKDRLPIGFAAFTAFVIGWVGAVICMDQVWFIGPVAALVGSEGADLGIWVGCGFALLVFPPLRWLELKVVGR